MTWLDKPFFDLLSQINGLLPFFMTQTRYLAGLVLLLNVSLTFIKYGITHTGLQQEVVKTITAVVIFTVIIGLYPTLINGLNTIVYKWAMGSTYTETVGKMIDKTRNDNGFWAKKGNKAESSYSDIIQKVAEEEGPGQVGYKYVLDLYLEGTGYFSPNAVMRVIVLIMEAIWNQASNINFFKNPGNYILTAGTAIAVLFAGALGAAQYFIAAIEFQLIAAVGIITLPGMLWNSTKFLTEKFIGAILGFFMNLLFVSIAIMLMTTGYLAILTREFTGTLDQIVYIVFMSIIYVQLCQNGPKLAVSLLTGTPQMSLMEGVAAASTLAAGAFMAAKGGATAATAVAGGLAHAAGAATQGASDAFKTSKSFGAGGFMAAANAAGAGILSSGAALGKSALKTVGSVAQTMSGSLLGTKGTNRHSTMAQFRNPEFQSPQGGGGGAGGTGGGQGTRKSVVDYVKDRFTAGKEMSAGFFSGDPSDLTTGKQFNTQNKAQLGLPSGNTPLALYPPGLPPSGLPGKDTPLALYPPGLPPSALPAPSGNDPQGLPPPRDKPALPPPTTQPSTLALPPPSSSSGS